jgi:NAD(P)-dependent dehydrogenase (short-subunit alcohol dehydrogenase family)
MSFLLKDKVALVTGANRGIGKALVDSFIAEGASKVYLAIRDVSSAAELVATYGERVVPVYLDLTRVDSISALAEVARDVDVVVNNAGMLSNGDLFADSFEQSFHAELEVNTFGLLRVARAFDPILRAKPNAAFVQLNSVGSIKNFDGLTSYCASKAATYTITQALKSEWSDSDIQVLSVHPGPIATDMARQVGMFDDAVATSVVADAIVQSLKDGDFHLFPDPLAQGMGAAYFDFSRAVIEAEAEAETMAKVA